MTFAELITRLREQIGDTDLAEPHITDEQYRRILEDSAREYSRIKNYLKFYEVAYDPEQNVYDMPEDAYKVKEVKLKLNPYYKIQFMDNVDQVILLNEPNVNGDSLRITYTRYFKPDEVIEREIDLLLLYGEALCYKLMAAKTAELIKFSTGEKTIDESGLSEKYLELHDKTIKVFRSRAVKAYGKRTDSPAHNLNPNVDYPPEGESL